MLAPRTLKAARELIEHNRRSENGAGSEALRGRAARYGSLAARAERAGRVGVVALLRDEAARNAALAFERAKDRSAAPVGR